jgi:hypothetical protein
LFDGLAGDGDRGLSALLSIESIHRSFSFVFSLFGDESKLSSSLRTSPENSGKI